MHKKYTVFIAVLALVAAAAYAKKYSHNNKKCDSKDSCEADKNCQCYCSAIGGYRDKVADDKPVYLPQGKQKGNKTIRCFCKQWDIDNFPGPTERE